MDMLGQCYDLRKKRTVEQVQNGLPIPRRYYCNARSPLYYERLYFVRSLVARCFNQTQISCQLCSKMCPLHKMNSTLLSIRNHTFLHLNKDIFQCILCEQRYQSFSSLKTHILQHHQLKSIEGAYMDYCDKYHQEFVDMLGKCFDPDSGNGVVK